MSTVEQTRPTVPADLANRAPDEWVGDRGVGDDSTLVSVVIPCLNEAENIERCVRTALEVLARNALDGEVLVVDNGSEDGSAALAAAAGRAGRARAPPRLRLAPTWPASPPRAGATS